MIRLRREHHSRATIGPEPLLGDRDLTSGVFVMSRRAFLRFGAGAVTLGGAGLLGACAPSSAPPAPPQPTATQAPAPTSGAATASQPTSPAPPTSAPATVAPVAVAPKPTSSSSRAAVQLPTYVPLAGIKPDLPASADGLVDAGFINYPANPI